MNRNAYDRMGPRNEEYWPPEYSYRAWRHMSDRAAGETLGRARAWGSVFRQGDAAYIAAYRRRKHQIRRRYQANAPQRMHPFVWIWIVRNR
jgi:hypothetical protein